MLEYLVLISLIVTITPDYLKKCNSEEATSEFYYWNKSQKSALTYQQEYCLMRCQGEERIIQEPASCWSFECLPCYCQRPACEIYDNCCPDISVPIGRALYNVSMPLGIGSRIAKRSIQDQRATSPILGCKGIPGTSVAYLYIRSCVPEYLENETVVELCERDFDLQVETMETFVKVVDMTTQVIYKNMFCALCSNVKEFVHLPTQLAMTTFSSYYQADDRDEMLRQALSLAPAVFISFPEKVTTFDCVVTNTKIVDHCRNSETSLPVDEDVVRACHSLEGNGLQVYHKMNQVVYKNIFCAICSMQSYPETFHSCVCTIWQFNIDPLPFSLLLDLRTRPGRAMPSAAKSFTHGSHCLDNEWTSPGGQCLPLNCCPGKSFQNGQCDEMFEEVRGLSYHLRLWLKPVPAAKNGDDLYTNISNTITVEDVKDLIVKIKERFEGLSKDYRFNLEAIQTNHPKSVGVKSLIFSLECDIVALRNLTRGQFETDIVNRFINTRIYVESAKNFTLTFETYPIMQGLTNGTDEKRNNAVLFSELIESEFLIYAPFISDFLSITEILLCRYVRFDQRLFEMTVDSFVVPPNISVTIDLNVTYVKIADLKDFSMVEIDEDGGLNVCQDLLDSKLKESDNGNIQHDLLNRKLSGTSLAEYIVSITCCVASIVCLLLTLLTYFLFPVLRTEAGINNMFLSCSLLLAQLSLLATAHIFRSSMMCTLLGLTTHFLWLWMFSWSFICSLHMFRVFTSNTRRTTTRQSEIAEMWKKVVLSLTCPALVVMATIVCSYLLSDGQEIGYGLSSCYLNSTLLVGVTLVAPLSGITVANLLFFLVSVYKIYNVRRLQSTLRNDDQQKNWYVYVRLSSVTGAFWTVAILASALDSNILKIVSVILNGLQGLTIFLSFICNKRVYSMYRLIVVKRPQDERGTQTGTQVSHN